MPVGALHVAQHALAPTVNVFATAFDGTLFRWRMRTWGSDESSEDIFLGSSMESAFAFLDRFDWRIGWYSSDMGIVLGLYSMLQMGLRPVVHLI